MPLRKIRAEFERSPRFSISSTDFVQWSAKDAPLPVSAEIDARLVVHRQSNKPVNLEAVRFLAVILAPRCLLGELD